MLTVEFLVFLEEGNEQSLSVIRELFRERFRGVDFVASINHVVNRTAIVCIGYFPETDWQQVFDVLWATRDYLRGYGTQVSQIIIDRLNRNEKITSLPFDLLLERKGVWTSISSIDEYPDRIDYLQSRGSEVVRQEWLFLPFDENRDDSEYESYAPGELIRTWGNRINGSARRASVPVSLRVRMMEGYKISDYVSTAYHNTLESIPGLGGINVILTTLLQMNDKLPLVNQYSEKLQQSEPLDMYSLSAMNLSLVDERDETNIAILVSSGKLVIDDIELGR